MKETWIEINLKSHGNLPELFYEFLYNYNCLGIKEESDNIIKIYFTGNSNKNEIIKEMNLKFPEKLKFIDSKQIFGTNWNENWKQFFKPVCVSPKIDIYAPWHERPLYDDKIHIIIEPKMAFGTGTHETTQLCILALEEMITQFNKPTILDIGCGSGILSILSSKLGAKSALGIDINQECIKSSYENAALNHVSNLFFTQKSLSKINEKFDIIVANLLFGELRKIKDEVYPRINDSGFFISSGFFENEIDSVLELFKDSFVKINSNRKGDWASLIFKAKLWKK